MRELQYRPRVHKQLKRIPKPERQKIFRKLEELVADTRSGKLLMGEYKGFLCLRAWPYRIIYIINNGTVIIYSVAHRQGVYQ